MIRIVITTTLIVATLTAGGIWASSFVCSVSLHVRTTPKFELHSSDGAFTVMLHTPTDARAGRVLKEVIFAGFKYRDELFDYHGAPPLPITRLQRFSFPGWLLILAFGAYPVYVLLRGPLRRRYSRAYRREQGLCADCCYNLTGNVSGICPECGTPVRSGGQMT